MNHNIAPFRVQQINFYHLAKKNPNNIKEAVAAVEEVTTADIEETTTAIAIIVPKVLIP